MRPGVLENVDGPESIVGDVEKRIRVACDDRRLRAGITNQSMLQANSPRSPDCARRHGRTRRRAEEDLRYSVRCHDAPDYPLRRPCGPSSRR